MYLDKIAATCFGSIFRIHSDRQSEIWVSGNAFLKASNASGGVTTTLSTTLS